MVLYHCMIELKNDARALAFASAVETWMGVLQKRGLVGDWHLMRRKLGLGSDIHSDFILQIEVASLTQLDKAFTELVKDGDMDARAYELMHEMIAKADVGLYRPYPDETQREHVALI